MNFGAAHSRGSQAVSTHTPKSALPLSLGRSDEGRLLTADEFADAEYEEPWTYERVDGRLVVIPPYEKDQKSTSEGWFERLLVYKLQNRERFRAICPAAWLRDRKATDRIGDFGVYLVRPDGAFDYPDQPPDIMFDTVGPKGRVQGRYYQGKRADYLRMGVREYVIIDPFRSQVTVLTRIADQFEERVLGLQDEYTTTLLPGFAVRVSEVFSG
jgi:Uma2 family endonuclease